MNGCSASSGSGKPFFSALSIASCDVPVFWHSAMKAATALSFAAKLCASGWSGATAMNDAPNKVSGRVV